MGENLSSVSLTPLNNFLEVSLTPVINLGFLFISDRYQRHRGTILSALLLKPMNSFSAVSLTPVNVIEGVNDTPDKLFAGVRQSRARPPESDSAADGVTGTAMKSCIHRHPTHLDQRPLRPPKILQTKKAIYVVLAASGASDQVVRGAYVCNFSSAFIFPKPIQRGVESL
jgi:hypothetical protein